MSVGRQATATSVWKVLGTSATSGTYVLIMCATHRSKTESRGATGAGNVIVRFTGLDTAAGFRSGAHTIVCYVGYVRARYCYHFPLSKVQHWPRSHEVRATPRARRRREDVSSRLSFRIKSPCTNVVRDALCSSPDHTQTRPMPEAKYTRSLYELDSELNSSYSHYMVTTLSAISR